MIAAKPFVVLVVLALVGHGALALTGPVTLPSGAAAFETATPPVWDQVEETQVFARALMDAAPAEQARMLSAKGEVDALDVVAGESDLETGLGWLLERSGQRGPLDGQFEFGAQRDLLTPRLEQVLERLVSAMVLAADLRDEAFSGLSSDEEARLYALLPYLEQGDGAGEGPPPGPVHHEQQTGGLDSPPTGLLHNKGDSLRREASRLLERVDPAPLYAAAAVLLQAATEAREDLEHMVVEGPLPSSPAAAGCDVLEVVPVLCVRGTADDVWTEDWWLGIDLGGDETFRNNQGATRFPDIPVALLLDVAGNDAYRTPELQSQEMIAPGTDWLVVQGAGVLGAGVLVDGGGDDDYEANARSSEERLVSGLYTVAQGAGLAGAGALVSMGGVDNFTARSENVAFRAVMTAQGAARYEAFGLVSRPGGLSTHYDAAAESLVHRWSSSVGINATMTRNTVSYASVFAQGAGAGAVAALVDAGGDDTYRAHARGIPVQLYAQGAGFFGPNVPGVGLLVDGGGSDTTHAQAVFLRDQLIEVVQRCADNQTCNRGHAFTAGESIPMRLFAQGAGDFGTGLLVDLGEGQNTREVSGQLRYNLTLHLHLEGEGSGRGNLTALVTIEPLHTAVFAQGAAVLGTGMLLSQGMSEDVYRLQAETHTHARSLVTGSDNPYARAVSQGGDARSWGQGYAATGMAVFSDRGGADRFEVSTDRSVSAEAGNFSWAQAGEVRWEGRGWADGAGGLALFADLGGDDLYGEVPGGAEPGSNDRCWMNQADIPLLVGIGVDSEVPFTSLLGEGCATGLGG